MQINELSPTHKSREKKRVGRGGRKGTYSGKGIKGQKSRAGRKMVPMIRELIKRYPKLKGYRSYAMEKNLAIVNLADLEKKTKDGDIITPAFLSQKGVIPNIKGKVPNVKILGTGKLTKKLAVEQCTVSKSAKEAIEKAGGNIKEVKSSSSS